MSTLDDTEVTRRLQHLPTWSRTGRALTRTVTTTDFMTGINLVTAVAAAAEEANHHPDIDIRYTTLRFTLTSHDAGGITERDFDLATRIDQLAAPTQHDT